MWNYHPHFPSNYFLLSLSISVVRQTFDLLGDRLAARVNGFVAGLLLATRMQVIRTLVHAYVAALVMVIWPVPRTLTASRFNSNAASP